MEYKRKYGHYRTDHVNQLKIRTICLGIVKAHDYGFMDDELRDKLLNNPISVYDYPGLGEFVHESFCGDVVHCDLKNDKSVDPYIKIHTHEKIEVYLKTKTWLQKREQVLKLANYICSDCKHDFSDAKDMLQAHHIDPTYPTLYREKNEDLMCLCEICHAKGHGHLWMYSMDYVVSSN